jgi:hypothetical protein
MKTSSLACALGLLLVAGTAGAQPGAPAYERVPAEHRTRWHTFPARTLPYEEGDPIPVGYAVEQRATRSLILLGGSMFGASYLVSAVVAGTVLTKNEPDASRMAPLLIPVAGPFITLANVNGGPGAAVFLTIDGVFQLTGAAMLVGGIAFPEKVLVLKPFPGATARVTVGPGSAGLAGEF